MPTQVLRMYFMRRRHLAQSSNRGHGEVDETDASENPFSCLVHALARFTHLLRIADPLGRTVGGLLQLGLDFRGHRARSFRS